jgi:hypothetical protein
MHCNRFGILVLSLAGVIFGSPTARATIAVEVFTFSGVCSDCTGDGTATLILQAGYDTGTPLMNMDLYSFNYQSNETSFSIFNDPTATLTGELPATSGPADVTVSGMNGTFMSSLDGAWSANDPAPADMGTTGIWAVPGGTTPTPEPRSFAVVGFGLLMLGMAVRMKSSWVRSRSQV